jgi:hypothetical protein
MTNNLIRKNGDNNQAVDQMVAQLRYNIERDLQEEAQAMLAQFLYDNKQITFEIVDCALDLDWVIFKDDFGNQIRINPDTRKIVLVPYGQI